MGGGKTFLYFAYGSNLLKERLQLMNPSAVFKCVGRLDNYALTFTNFNFDPLVSRWRGSAATIEAQPGDSVCGCVWELNMEDMPSLDRQEGLYKAVDVEVDVGNSKLICRTYLDSERALSQFPVGPSPQYKDVILRGARQNNLPEEYICKLEAIRDNGYSGRVEVYEKTLEHLDKSSL